MTTQPTADLGFALGDRLSILGVLEPVTSMPHRFQQLIDGTGILVVIDTPKKQWGIAKPDMPYAQFLKEVLP